MSTPDEVHRPKENRILAALPPEDYERLSPHLTHVEMPSGKQIYEADGQIEHVYFPIGSMISLVSQMADGLSVEVGVTGYDGMSGISIVMGVDKSAHEAMVQLPDGAMRMRADALKAEFKRGGALQDLLLRYSHSFCFK